MDALPLDPDGYGGTYKLVGGRPCLDLVNTVSWPGTDRQHDWFGVAGNVDRWLSGVGLERAPSVHLDEVRGIRSVIADVIRPVAAGSAPAGGAVERFNHQLASATALRRIDPVDLGWTWRTPSTVGEALAPVVLDAAECLVSVDRGRLKHCPSCDWVFEDQTRNKQRRWCDMDDCGSRAKARAYYHRKRA